MAKITSNITQYDWRSIEYLGVLRDYFTYSKFYNNTFSAVNGIGYEDTLLLLLNDGTNKYIADFKGVNILYAEDLSGAPAISGGSLKYIALVSDVGGKFIEDLTIEDFSYSAKAFYAAAQSTSTADDSEVIMSILEGNDTFYLSDLDDSATGYAGDDIFFGQGGDDLFGGGIGNDRIAGDGGVDTSLYIGKFNEYKFSESGSDYLIVSDSQRGRDGIDTLEGVELLSFSDLLVPSLLLKSSGLTGFGKGVRNLTKDLTFKSGDTLVAPALVDDLVDSLYSSRLSYQWYLNGAPIAGATRSSFATPLLAGAGNYKVAITYSYDQGFRATVSTPDQLIASANPSPITTPTPSSFPAPKVKDSTGKEVEGVSSEIKTSTLSLLTSTVPLKVESSKLLERYRVNDSTSSTPKKASDIDSSFIDFTIKTGALKSLTAEVALDKEVKANAYVKVNPNTGEAFDFTYDPVTGLGAELLDTNKNGLVDSLRIHLQDGGLGDVDGAVNGSIRDPGVLAEAPRTPVYRFYRNGVHFYTTSDAERDNVIKQSYGSNTSYSDLSANPQAKDPITGGWGYKFEGVAYQALDTQGTALYRFFSPSKSYHFVTTNAKEALTVIQNSVGSSYDLSNAQGQKLLDKGWGFQFEGNSYKVSTIAQTGMDNPVYRFFNATKGVHFYSSSMVEAKSVITNSLGASYATDSWISSTSDAIKAGNTSTPAPLANGWGYSFEGIAWYV